MSKSPYLLELRQILERKKSAYILIYNNPDPDGLASAWALKEIFQWMKVSAQIGYTGKIGRLQNATMVESLKIPVLPFDPVMLKQSELVAMVDAQPSFFQGIDLPRCDIVIDHHPVKPGRKARFSDLRPRCLAASSILTEYLLGYKIRVSKKLATALYYGIITDRSGQQKLPSEIDERALTFLEKKADKNLIRRFDSSKYSLHDLEYFNLALIKYHFAGHVLYVHLGPVPYSDVCVQVAEFLALVQEVHWVVVSGVVGTKLVIVVRCDGYNKHGGNVVQEAFGRLGSAGGHRTMARAEIPAEALPLGVALTKNEGIEWFVANTFSKNDRAFRPLVHLLKKKRVDYIARQTKS